MSFDKNKPANVLRDVQGHLYLIRIYGVQQSNKPSSDLDQGERELVVIVKENISGRTRTTIKVSVNTFNLCRLCNIVALSTGHRL